MSAGLVAWPDCQECMSISCPQSIFIDLIIDHQDSYYICKNPEVCPLQDCPAVTTQIKLFSKST